MNYMDFTSFKFCTDPLHTYGGMYMSKAKGTESRDIVSKDRVERAIVGDTILLGELRKSGIICPVCKELLHENNLPDRASIVNDCLQIEGIHFVNDVQIHCDFCHCYDEKGFTIDDPHSLTAVISVHFDGTGECTAFDIIEIVAE